MNKTHVHVYQGIYCIHCGKQMGFDEDTPINPAQARQKLNCLAKYRGLLEEYIGNFDSMMDNEALKNWLDDEWIPSVRQALKEESERG